MRTHITIAVMFAALISIDYVVFDGQYSNDAWQRIKLETQGLRIAFGDVARKVFS